MTTLLTNAPIWDTDDVVASTRTHPDDERWKKQRRTGRQKGTPPEIPDNGPCCALCASWRAPAKADGFGRCSLAVVLVKRIPNGDEKGAVVSYEDAVKDWRMEWELLRTKAGAVCQRFREAS